MYTYYIMKEFNSIVIELPKEMIYNNKKVNAFTKLGALSTRNSKKSIIIREAEDGVAKIVNDGNDVSDSNLKERERKQTKKKEPKKKEEKKEEVKQKPYKIQEDAGTTKRKPVKKEKKVEEENNDRKYPKGFDDGEKETLDDDFFGVSKETKEKNPLKHNYKYYPKLKVTGISKLNKGDVIRASYKDGGDYNLENRKTGVVLERNKNYISVLELNGVDGNEWDNKPYLLTPNSKKSYVWYLGKNLFKKYSFKKLEKI